MVAPQMAGANLFLNTGDSIAEGKFIEEYNPKIRVDENVLGLQKMLDLFAFKIGSWRGLLSSG